MKNAAISLLFLSLFAYIATAATNTDDKSTYTFTAQRDVGQTDRVTVLMEVGGDFKEPAGGKEPRTKMSGTVSLAYDEMTLAAKPDGLRSVRFYNKAQSTARFKDGVHSPSLAPSRRLVGVAFESGSSNLFAVREPMTRDELEAIDIVGNSLLLDRLLPKKAVAIGDSWKPDDAVAAALFGLDSVTRNDVQCMLKEVTPTLVRFEFAGGIEGPVNDTKSQIDVKGKYRFDRRTQRVDWFAMLMKEDRGTSRVALGFDVTVRFQMTVAPTTSSPELGKENLAGLKTEPTKQQTSLVYQSPQRRWAITYDRDWFLNSDDRENAILKLIRQGAMTGQCNIASLQERAPDNLVSLEEYQDSVRRALGDAFGQFVEAKQWVDESKHRVLRVVANGTVRGKAEVPVCWIYYHIADPRGRQVAMTFTVEQGALERFAEADRAVVASLRFAHSGDVAPLAKPDARPQTKGLSPLAKKP